MARPPLPFDVVVMDGTDVAAAWDDYEVFEALHHEMRICNPMGSADLDRLLDQVAPADGESMLDIACGHGELLVRSAKRAAIQGVGIDLSPWAISRAYQRATAAQLRGSLQWRLGDAHELGTTERFAVVTCLGASWIWHGFRGTAAAMVKRTTPDGRIAIGDLRLRDGADAAAITAEYGRVLTADEQLTLLEDLGVDVTYRFDADDAGWDGYQDRVMRSAQAWAQRHPGETSQRYLDEQRRWRADHRRDWEFLNWTIWVGRVRRPALC